MLLQTEPASLPNRPANPFGSLFREIAVDGASDAAAVGRL